MDEIQKLSNFMDSVDAGQAVLPETDEQALALEVMMLVQNTGLDPEYHDALKTQLKTAPIAKNTAVKNRYWRLVAGVGVLLMVSVLTVLTVPPIRALASEWVASFFQHSQESKHVIVYEELGEDDIIGIDTVEALVERVPFDVRYPQFMLDEFVYAGASFMPYRNIIFLHFNKEDYGRLYVTYQPLVDTDKGMLYFIDPQEHIIGPEARVDEVNINGLPGQYVYGAWVTGGSSRSGEQYIWSDTFPAERVRWQDSEFVYEVSWVGVHDEEKQPILLQIAESLYTVRKSQ